MNATRNMIETHKVLSGRIYDTTSHPELL